MDFLSTKQAADRLGVTTSALQRAVWDGRIPEPARGPGNARLWTEADLQRASRTMRGARLEQGDTEAQR